MCGEGVGSRAGWHLRRRRRRAPPGTCRSRATASAEPGAREAIAATRVFVGMSSFPADTRLPLTLSEQLDAMLVWLARSPRPRRRSCPPRRDRHGRRHRWRRRRRAGRGVLCPVGPDGAAHRARRRPLGGAHHRGPRVARARLHRDHRDVPTLRRHPSGSEDAHRRLGGARKLVELHGISRTMIRLVAPGVPARRPAVSTTRAPLDNPA
jgi:hypothetical protein